MIRAYLASSSFMDWNVGRVLEELDELGLREKTIVVFWGDHGYQLGEKGKWSKAGSLWEQGTRTPFLICDPREKTAGKVCPRVVQMVDLYPTLVELCGLEQPAGLEGRSLSPLAEDSGCSMGSSGLHRVERGRETFHRRDGSHRNNGVTPNSTDAARAAMLLDPAADPHELTNLVNDPKHADVVATTGAAGESLRRRRTFHPTGPEVFRLRG